VVVVVVAVSDEDEDIMHGTVLHSAESAEP